MKTKGQQFIEKTALHTFTIADKYFFKIINVNYDNQEYVISLQFNEEKAYVHAYRASSFSRESVNGKQYVSTYYRNCLFPRGICYDMKVDSWEKRHSIPTFKAMKELVNEIKELIKDMDPMDGVTLNKISDLLKDKNFKVLEK